MMKLIKRLLKKKQPEIKAELMEVVKIRGVKYCIVAINYETTNNTTSFVIRYMPIE